MLSLHLHKIRLGRRHHPPEFYNIPTVINVMLWMKKEAYEDSTVKATAKRLEHLQRNCTLADPENIKTYVANKQCSNAIKECLNKIQSK